MALHLASDHTVKEPSSQCADCLNVEIGSLQAELDELKKAGKVLVADNDRAYAENARLEEELAKQRALAEVRLKCGLWTLDCIKRILELVPALTVEV